MNTYIPQEHQHTFHEDTHRFKGSFGGYGTGKTLTDREEFYKHMCITPEGNGLIGANIISQFDATIKRDIEADIPQALVQSVSAQKNYIDFINGYRLMFRPFDDPDKLRSLNLDFFLILEASEVRGEAYTQLKTRIRNLAATKAKRDPKTNEPLFTYNRQGVPQPVLEFDWRQGIIESNPDSGWIKTEHLAYSDAIHTFGTLREVPKVDPKKKDPAISSYIVASDCNVYLPPNFIEDVKRNKPLWWVARYVEGSFMYSEGKVYPNASKCVVPDYQIPREWKRILAHDYGLVDPSVFLIGAIDQRRGKLVIYRELRVQEKSIKELSDYFFRVTADVPAGGWVCSPLIDPKSGTKRDYGMTNLLTHYLEYGINFEPGAIGLDARIFKLNTYIEGGSIEIQAGCKHLIKELEDYKFQTARHASTELSDKPVDKDNHSINCLEWIVMKLPSDPKAVAHGAWDAYGRDLTQQRSKDYKSYVGHIFSDDDSDNYSDRPYGINFKFGGM